MNEKCERLIVIGGRDRKGDREPITGVTFYPGEIVSIVGPTGSGKSTLIRDIEQLAIGDTASGRTVMIGERPLERSSRTDPRNKPVAQLSQNMHFLADMRIGEFLRMHARSRGRAVELVPRVIETANLLTGEPVTPDDHLTALSGGQSRALMAADIAIISDSPIVLIDEIENAGIRKQEALRLLAGQGKIVLVVTHDPLLALMAKRRIVMSGGGMRRVLERSPEEERMCLKLTRMDEEMIGLRETIRNGGAVGAV